MAPPVEEKTTSLPWRLAASSTLTVPSTLIAPSLAGSAVARRTSTCAARWKHSSGRASSNTSSSGSRMSASTSRTPSGTCSRLPLERSSTTTTSSPRASSASTMCEPMKPAPPVTTARTALWYDDPMFVTFEGLDGSGKSTQARLLAQHLTAGGREVVATREPGGTPLGERVRDVLLHGDQMSPWAEAALFAAARAELVHRVIRPAIERGADVVCDRYLDSSLAYQGIARGLGVEPVLELNLAVVGGLLPDRTFVLLVDPDEASQRARTAPDRIEREGEEFHAALDRAYRRLPELFPDRVVALDGAGSREEVAARVLEELGK